MKFFILGCLFTLSIVTSAQEKELELDPITVTASLQSQSASRTGRNLVVIQAETLKNIPAFSLDEILKYLPGLEVQARGPFGAQSDIVLRGGTFQQVLVLLDGMRINDPNTGHFNSYIPINISEIDRIEILKGAASAMYGSDAVGGVVQVITKNFSRTALKPGWSVESQVTGGEYDLANVQLSGSISSSTSSVTIGYSGIHTNGQLLRGARGFVDNDLLSLSAQHNFKSNWRLAVRTSIDNRDFNAQNFYTSFVSDTATERVSNSWSQVLLSHTGTKHQTSFSAGYKNVLDRYSYNKISIQNSNRSEMWQALASDEWHMNDQTTLVQGVQFINKGIASNDRGDHQLPQAAAFITVSQKIKQALTLQPSIRLDWNKLSKFEVVPQMNISFRKKTYQLRASGGKTIRDADFTERFNNYNKSFVSGGSIGNPDLLAERSFSYEAGIDYFGVENLKLSTSFFQRFHHRLIDYVPTPYANIPRKENLSATGSYALAQNLADLTTTGAELDVQYIKAFSKQSNITIGSGLILLHTHSDTPVTSFYLSSHAKTLLNFFADYTNRYIVLSATGIYKKRNERVATAINTSLESDYFILNARAAATLYKTILSCFVQANNLTNKKYSDVLGSIMPARWISGGLVIKFNKAASRLQ